MEVASGTEGGLSSERHTTKRIDNVSFQRALKMESDVSRRVSSVKRKRGDAMGSYQVVLLV